MNRHCLFHYRTRVGTFWIAQQPGGRGRFLLGIGDEALGSYHSPAAAADDVYCQATGCYEWDALGPVTSPTDLSEWRKGPPDR